MEGWTDIMYIYMDAYNNIIVIFYYISCVVLCALFLLNMTIAVMLNQYEELDKKESSKEANEIRQMGLNSNLPVKLVDFILDHDLCIKKPKEEQSDLTFSERIWKIIWAKPKIPEDDYY